MTYVDKYIDSAEVPEHKKKMMRRYNDLWFRQKLSFQAALSACFHKDKDLHKRAELDWLHDLWMCVRLDDEINPPSWATIRDRKKFNGIGYPFIPDKSAAMEISKAKYTNSVACDCGAYMWLHRRGIGKCKINQGG